MREISGAEKAWLYNTEIAKKTDFAKSYVTRICYLLDHGEERLLPAVEKGVIPPTVAMEIRLRDEGRHPGGLCRSV